MNNNINFALITSNSLMDKIPNWDSYQSMDEAQFIDLIDYSKSLVTGNSDHEITFLVVAQGIDEQEQKESEEEVAAKELLRAEESKKAALRAKSKSILNSIYKI